MASNFSESEKKKPFKSCETFAAERDIMRRVLASRKKNPNLSNDREKKGKR